MNSADINSDEIIVKAKNKKNPGKKKKGKKKKGKKIKPTRSPTTAPTKKPTSSDVRVLVTFESRSAMLSAKSDPSAMVTMEDDSWMFLGMEMSAQKVKDYKQDPFVKFVDIDHEMTTYAFPSTQDIDSDRMLTEEIPWGVSTVLQDVEFFNNISVNGPKKVCVADTGYGLGHEDLPSGNDVTGKDGSGENWDFDGENHGTHCSGTVAATGENGKGVVGVIPDNKGGNFQLLVGKALNKKGSGSASTVMKAVQGCLDQGADVISLSLGCNNCKTQTEKRFYDNLYKKNNVLLVAAAGNSGNSARSYPATYESVMSVASLKPDLQKNGFSQFNDQVEISAPGTAITSAIPGDKYATWDGTSMATPHVAGVAGLLWMIYPECTNYQIRNVLNKSAMDVSKKKKGCDKKTGYGLVQAKSAYDLLAQGNCGGDIGTKEPLGGCYQLLNIAPTVSPAPTYSTLQPTKAPTKKPTKKPKKKKKKKGKKKKKRKPPTKKPTRKPTLIPTAIPTFTPTGTFVPTATNTLADTSTPTKSPTSFENDDYSNDDVVIRIELKLDWYPEDTSWELFSPSGELILNSENYTEQEQSKKYIYQISVSRGCYTFVIYDEFQDGICCAWGKGSYKIRYDGDLAVDDGGDFESEMTEVFGDC